MWKSDNHCDIRASGHQHRAVSYSKRPPAFICLHLARGMARPLSQALLPLGSAVSFIPFTNPKLASTHELTALVLILVKEFMLRGFGRIKVNNKLSSFCLAGYLKRKCRSLGHCSGSWVRCYRALPAAVQQLPGPASSLAPPLGKLQQMPTSTLPLSPRLTSHVS